MKQVVLRFAEGDFSRGFATVTAQVWEADHAHPVQAVGSLPAAPQLAIALQQWRLLYVALYHRLDLHTRIDIELADVTNVSEVEFTHLCQAVQHQLNNWLNADTFRNIDQRLRTQLTPADEIRCIIETNQPQLWLLPWHQWQFFEDFPHAEVALSVANYRRLQTTAPLITTGEVRILAVLGNSEAIDIETDRRYLEQLSSEATVQFLVQPSREVLHEYLWQRWHIWFFAGHSSSSTTAIASSELDAASPATEAISSGQIAINATERLTLEQLRYALRQAIAQGLQLAIFNSCDGLGLARSLADLQIPQVIVMREPVPDIVAQRFLKHFLTAFTSGRSLYSAVREARERLQGLESHYPCASWLPVICQNPSVPPTSWQDWCGAPPQSKQVAPPPPQPKKAQIWLRALKALLISLLITLLLITLRFFGLFQASELRAYDHLMQWRPPESQDQRLLIIAVTEQDLGLPIQQDRKGSLSDTALSRVLNILVAAQPRAIGLDILRDFPASDDQTALIKQMQSNPDFFAICWASNPDMDIPGVAPPPEVPLSRQGFADVLTDADHVARRHLIAMNPIADSPCQAPYALSTQLALRYLAAEQITAKYAEQRLQVGNVIFPPLLPHQGTYHKANTQGYQILLNYRQVAEIAPVKTLAEVLSGQLQPEEVRDRVVLIGVTAPSVKDILLTPLRVGQHSSRRMFGVMLQAQMVSHLISTVKDGRPQIRFWSFRGDAIWIWLWCSLAGLLTLLFRHPLQLFFYTGILLGVLYLSCYQLLTVGWWVPLIPVAIGLMVTTAAVSSSGQIGKTGD